MKYKHNQYSFIGLLLFFMLSACNGSGEPTTTSVAQAPEQPGPTIQIGSAALGPDKTMEVCTGKKNIALTTRSSGRNLSYTWSLDGNGQLLRSGTIKGDEGSSNRYSAPDSVNEEVVKVTITDEFDQSANDQVIIQVVE